MKIVIGVFNFFFLSLDGCTDVCINERLSRKKQWHQRITDYDETLSFNWWHTLTHPDTHIDGRRCIKKGTDKSTCNCNCINQSQWGRKDARKLRVGPISQSEGELDRQTPSPSRSLDQDSSIHSRIRRFSLPKSRKNCISQHTPTPLIKMTPRAKQSRIRKS